MLLDAANHARLDHDVGLPADRLVDAIEQVPGMHDDALGRRAVLPRELEGDPFGNASLRDHPAQSAGREVDKVLRVPFPAWRLRLIGGDDVRRAGRAAALVHRDDPQRAFAYEGHAEPVRGPDRTGVLTIAS